MLRTLICWSLVGGVVSTLFVAGHFMARTERNNEVELPPILHRMPAYHGEPLEYADEASHRMMEESMRPQVEPDVEKAIVRPAPGAPKPSPAERPVGRLTGPTPGVTYITFSTA